jgi:hypothetical protein
MVTNQSKHPTEVAKSFALKMSQSGYCLDFSLKSLIEEVDRLIDTELGLEPIGPESWGEATNLEAYVGETLCKLFNGKWAGDFHQDSGVNFYTSFIIFGEYKLYPSHFIAYRVSNGKKEVGSFSEYFKIVEPNIRNRIAN